MTDVQTLKKIYLFEGMSAEELEQLAEIAHETDIIAGDDVFGEGSLGTALFIIKSGTVNITKRLENGDDMIVATFGPGSHFGEMAYFDGMPRSATATVKESAKLLRIEYSDMVTFIEKNPMAGLKLYRAALKYLCKRIHQTTNDLTSLKDLKLRHL